MEPWRRHLPLTMPFVEYPWHLLRLGDPSAVVNFLERLLAHRRVAAVVLGNPLSHHLPWALLEVRDAFDEGVIEELLLNMSPYMPAEEDGTSWAQLALWSSDNERWPLAAEPDPRPRSVVWREIETVAETLIGKLGGENGK